MPSLEKGPHALPRRDLHHLDWNTSTCPCSHESSICSQMSACSGSRHLQALNCRRSTWLVGKNVFMVSLANAPSDLTYKTFCVLLLAKDSMCFHLPRVYITLLLTLYMLRVEPSSTSAHMKRVCVTLTCDTRGQAGDRTPDRQ